MKFYSFDLDVDSMTLILKLNLHIIKMYEYTKIKFLSSAVQKLLSEQTHREMDRHTDRHTYRRTQLKLLPTTYADGNYTDISEMTAGNILE